MEFLDDMLDAVEDQLNSKNTIYVKDCFEKLCSAGKSELEAKKIIAKELFICYHLVFFNDCGKKQRGNVH